MRGVSLVYPPPHSTFPSSMIPNAIYLRGDGLIPKIRLTKWYGTGSRQRLRQRIHDLVEFRRLVYVLPELRGQFPDELVISSLCRRGRYGYQGVGYAAQVYEQ